MTTASGSTAGSSGTCRTSASTSSRAGRAPASCGSRASARCPATGSRRGRKSAFRRPRPRRRAPARPQPKREPLTPRRGAVRPRHGDLRGSERVRAQQAAGPGDAGRDQDHTSISTGCSTGWRDERGRPKLVHRLDKDTSGALLVARTRAFGRPFRQGLLGPNGAKVYWAIVVGVPDAERGRDRRAARQAAGHGRREDAHQRGAWACRRRPAGG